MKEETINKLDKFFKENKELTVTSTSITVDDFFGYANVFKQDTLLTYHEVFKYINNNYYFSFKVRPADWTKDTFYTVWLPCYEVKKVLESCKVGNIYG